MFSSEIRTSYSLIAFQRIHTSNLTTEITHLLAYYCFDKFQRPPIEKQTKRNSCKTHDDSLAPSFLTLTPFANLLKSPNTLVTVVVLTQLNMKQFRKVQPFLNKKLSKWSRRGVILEITRQTFLLFIDAKVTLTTTRTLLGRRRLKCNFASSRLTLLPITQHKKLFRKSIIFCT